MTNKEKLQKVLSLIKVYLTKQKNKSWITPDDKRYTKILKKYEPKLAKVWQHTKDAYLRKLKKKDLTDFDDTPSQYEDPQFDSSQYIDEALKVLAEAFGAGVIIGFEEIINRDITVKIPENPFKLFDTAKEIKNYEWAALSYEQSQMEAIFKEYNKLDNAEELIAKWFDNNEYRLTELILGGLIWYSIQFGFAQAIMEAQRGQAGSNILAYWLTENDKKVCKDCDSLEKNNPYSEENPLPTLPGGGKTLCGSKCRCVIDYKEQ
jgi:hypothetical protein